jgi:regulator of protease activity HflC (stomatin/prohibitin superfamily)
VRTPDGMNPRVFPSGDWTIGVWDHATNYSIRSQEREEELEVLTLDGLRLLLDTSVRFHIVPGDAVKLDEELGPEYYAVLVGPTLRSQARRVVGRFKPEEIYSSQREAIEREIRGGVEASLTGRHIVLEAVLIRNVKLPDTIQAAINDKLTKEQEALRMKWVLEQAASEQQKKLIEMKAEIERENLQAQAARERERLAAQSAAETTRTRAQADADAKRLEAQATADYERLVQKYLTTEIEANAALAQSPNSKLVLFGAGAGRSSTLLDMRGRTTGSDTPYP